MALQDLTPQLRTRLTRVERLVGLFLTLATLLFLAGFAYYLYHTASRKGWFVTKVEYQTSINDVSGLRVGSPVFLMGFQAGTITRIIPNRPEDWFNVTIHFEVHDSRDGPYYGYVWTDSQVRVAAADLLGNRFLEVIKGREGVPTVLTGDGEVLGILDRAFFLQERERLEGRFAREGRSAPEAQQLAIHELRLLAEADPERFYQPTARIDPYWLDPIESPAVTERIEQVMNIVETALPNFLSLTNQITAALDQATAATGRMETMFSQTEPLLDNLAGISENLRDPDGSLGRWLLSARGQRQVEETLLSAERALRSADSTLQGAEEDLASLVENLHRSLDNLAALTSNLNAQVEANTNILSELSSAVIHTDELVQGLKRHWLLRSAFRDDEPRQRERPAEPLLPPRLR